MFGRSNAGLWSVLFLLAASGGIFYFYRLNQGTSKFLSPLSNVTENKSDEGSAKQSFNFLQSFAWPQRSPRAPLSGVILGESVKPAGVITPTATSIPEDHVVESEPTPTLNFFSQALTPTPTSVAARVSPTPTPTATPSPTLTPTPTLTATATPTVVVTATATPTPSVTGTPMSSVEKAVVGTTQAVVGLLVSQNFAGLYDLMSLEFREVFSEEDFVSSFSSSLSVTGGEVLDHPAIYGADEEWSEQSLRLILADGTQKTYLLIFHREDDSWRLYGTEDQ